MRAWLTPDLLARPRGTPPRGRRPRPSARSASSTDDQLALHQAREPIRFAPRDLGRHARLVAACLGGVARRARRPSSSARMSSFQSSSSTCPFSTWSPFLTGSRAICPPAGGASLARWQALTVPGAGVGDGLGDRAATRLDHVDDDGLGDARTTAPQPTPAAARTASTPKGAPFHAEFPASLPTLIAAPARGERNRRQCAIQGLVQRKSARRPTLAGHAGVGPQLVPPGRSTRLLSRRCSACPACAPYRHGLPGGRTPDPGARAARGRRIAHRRALSLRRRRTRRLRLQRPRRPTRTASSASPCRARRPSSSPPPRRSSAVTCARATWCSSACRAAR